MAEGFLHIPEDPDKVSRARAWKNGGEVPYHCRAASHILCKGRSMHGTAAPLRIAEDVGEGACKALKALVLSSSPPTSVRKEGAPPCCCLAGPRSAEWILHTF